MNHVLRKRAFPRQGKAGSVASFHKREKHTFIRFLANLLSVYFSLRIQAFGILTSSARWKIRVAQLKVFHMKGGKDVLPRASQTCSFCKREVYFVND